MCERCAALGAMCERCAALEEALSRVRRSSGAMLKAIFDCGAYAGTMFMTTSNIGVCLGTMRRPATTTTKVSEASDSATELKRCVLTPSAAAIFSMVGTGAWTAGDARGHVGHLTRNRRGTSSCGRVRELNPTSKEKR